MIKKAIIKLIRKAGYDLVKLDSATSAEWESDTEFLKLYHLCKPYTMTSIERMYALYNAAKYVNANKISGAFVECGVWRGGSSMLAASALKSIGETTREIYLYDTFEGMSEPEAIDESIKGEKMTINWEGVSKDDKLFCYSSLDEVKANIGLIEYEKDAIKFVKGKVEETIPNILPSQIAILRLDTDWYSSTYHELVYLFPLLVDGGVLIIDDYGHWKGARKAVDTFFSEQGIKPLLNRIDYTGRIMIKMPHL